MSAIDDPEMDGGSTLPSLPALFPIQRFKCVSQNFLIDDGSSRLGVDWRRVRASASGVRAFRFSRALADLLFPSHRPSSSSSSVLRVVRCALTTHHFRIGRVATERRLSLKTHTNCNKGLVRVCVNSMICFHRGFAFSSAALRGPNGAKTTRATPPRVI